MIRFKRKEFRIFDEWYFIPISLLIAISIYIVMYIPDLRMLGFELLTGIIAFLIAVTLSVIFQKKPVAEQTKSKTGDSK